MKALKKDFRNMAQMPLFEIEVIHKVTGKQDWILFHIEIRNNSFIATHEPLTMEEVQSDKIAFKAVDMDESFSLDAHLADLFDTCHAAIIQSDFFTLP